MSDIKVTDLKRAINLQIKSGNAVLLLGLPGIGKTQIAQSWLEENTDRVIVIDGSQTPQELVQGVPFVSNNSHGVASLSRELMFQMNDIKEELNVTDSDGHKHTVGLDLEELSSFTQDDQRAVMNMILAGQMPDGSSIDRNRLLVIATANPSSYMDDQSDASVNDIENALFTRMAVYNVVPDVVSWLAYARQSNIHPAIIYALTNTPELFKDEAHRTVPRTLTFLSNVMYTADKHGFDMKTQDFEALIGAENAPQFKHIYDHFASLVSLVDVVDNLEQESRFLTLDDAERSFVWLNGLENISVTPAHDAKLRQLAESLPIDTLIASFRLTNEWTTNSTLKTALFLAGAWSTLKNVN
ncbi:ATP-binding protein [Weissella cibaria]|uniref:ATP-binding protein n=1 Tax=Weissella cibaria TaxID=137591 RepID=UPI0015F3C737|nr:ATP-binding protein [Weissella cibaria]MBA5963184.1 ATP-binding protein [Weissella cibaria]